MAITIVTRAGKGSALNATEFDANLTNLAAAIENTSTGHDHDGTDSKKTTAANVLNVAAGGIDATDVQSAINELDTEKLAKASNLSDVANAATAFANIKQSATTSATGVVELATVAEAVAGTSTTLTPTCDGVAAAVAVVERAPNQGVNMTYAASGSTGIQVADNDNIDFGTGNFFGVIPVLLADYTPAAEVVLEQKTDGTNGREFTLQTNGKLRVTINTTDYDSTAATGCTDNTKHVFGYSVTRETAAAAGSIIFVVDGVQLGNTVAITAGAPTTINNAVSQYVLGTSATRTAGTVNGYISGNRALTAAEHLALYRNGISEADKWGSQTPIYTSDFSAGVDLWSSGDANVTLTGNTDSIDGEDDWLKVERINTAGRSDTSRTSGFTAYKHNSISFKVYNNAGSGFTHFAGYKASGSRISGVVAVAEGASGTLAMSHINTSELSPGISIYISPCDVSGNMITNAAVGSLWYVKNINAYNSGATLALEPEGIQPNPGQWLDSSTNKLHAMQPATGSSLTRRKKDFEYRWTNTWTASSAAQYVGGLNQAVLSADHFITDIITQATVTTDVENLTLGDGSDADRFVTAFAPSATRTKQTVAAQNDGTNLKLVYTPAAEATMTVETIIRGFIWEP